ncbi:hypothetical protein [Actinomadura rupiterrae]|uniref:hypothetical protein n=1 Tax=Actinomadura rupiterrae TaxID=559627 RepID=UPI0020A45356|nr:hypothetical protein [Actinomadura rupiterrae]MCP2341555.1 hypothetical protein [Actinomadura rupiterrae]
MAELADLEGIIGPSVIAPRPVDWTAMEETFGLRLPADYKRLFDRYDNLDFDNFLGVFNPGPDADAVLADVGEALEPLRILTAAHETIHLMDDHGRSRHAPRFPIYPQPGGLLHWGTTQNGDSCLWLTTEPDPERWDVVVTDGGDWWRFHGTFVDFLVGVMERSVRCPIFPDGFPSSRRVDQFEVHGQ